MSSNRNTIIRSLHDVGGAAWFGGSLMGAVAVNGASKDIKDPAERAAIAADGWARWAPVSAAAIGAHVIGGVGLLLANRDRVRNQPGVGTSSAVKAALTVAALGTTLYSGILGAKIAAEAGGVPVEGGTVPSEATPDKAARLLQQQRVLQWVTPALTAGIIITGAQQGEQQRGSEQLRSRSLGAVRDAVSRVQNIAA